MGASREQRHVVNRNARPKVLCVYVASMCLYSQSITCAGVVAWTSLAQNVYGPFMFVCTNIHTPYTRALHNAYISISISISICSYRRATAEKSEVPRNRPPRLAPLQQRPRRSYRHECERESQCVWVCAHTHVCRMVEIFTRSRTSRK